MQHTIKANGDAGAGYAGVVGSRIRGREAASLPLAQAILSNKKEKYRGVFA